MTFLHRLRHAAAARLGNEHGSVAASVAFSAFTAMMVIAIVTAVISALATASILNTQTNVSGTLSYQQDSFLSQSIRGNSTPAAETCDGIICSQVTGTADADGLRSVTVQGRAGDKGPTNRTSTLRELTPTLMTGFDAFGNPVWKDQADTTPYRFTSVVSRGNSSCAIDTAKAVWCWGANDQGQLGDGTTTSRPAPVKIQGTATFTALASGSGSTFCGLAEDGKAWCWGDNAAGQLGTGTAGTDSPTPVTPTGAHTFTAVFQGPNTTCAIDTAKATWCWGENPGDAGLDGAAEPATVTGMHDFKTLTMDASTVCGIDTAGKIYCWSTTANGRTGTAAYITEGVPVEVAGGRTYTHVHAAAQEAATPSLICALDSTSEAWCWGEGGSGQLGNGTTTSSLTPVAVSGGKSFKSLTPSPSAVCAIDSTDKTWCWGDNASGQLGIGSTTDAKTPAAVDTAVTYSSLSAATGNGKWFCGLTTTGAPRCWGSNAYGQAQAGSTANVTSPSPVGSFSALRSLSTASGFACVTDARSEASCWGQNNAGQTGSGTATPSSTPAPAARKDITPTRFTGYVKGGK